MKNKPILSPMEHHDKWMLIEDFTIQVNGYEITIQQGFIFDGASTPSISWSLIGHPFDADFIVAGLIHDGLYAEKALPRGLCDDIFYTLLRRDGNGWGLSQIMYQAVNLFGAKYYGTNPQEKTLLSRVGEDAKLFL